MQLLGRGVGAAVFLDEDHGDRLADGFAGRPPEQPFGAGGPFQDRALAVEHDHGMFDGMPGQ